jgi:hypothetical protein
MPAMPHTLRAQLFIAAVPVAAVVAVLFRSEVAMSLVLSLTPALVAWYLWDRPHELRTERRAKGLCLGCGYDLWGNVSGVCPECGKAKA